jgi:acetyl esterase
MLKMPLLLSSAKCFLLSFCLFLLSGYPGHSQGKQPAVVHVQKVYKTVDTLALTAHVFYSPAALKKKGKTALAFFHGGGWAFGKPEEFFNACRRYAEMGFVAVSFQYRLADDKDKSQDKKVTPIDCVVDARSAMRWLRENAREYGIDPAKIVAGGQSVGGQLVLATAMLDAHNDPRDNAAISPVPNAMILWSGTANTVTPWCDILLGNKRDQIWSISPAHNLKPGLPPAIAFHGSADNVVDFWTVGFFARDMKQLGNSFELHRYEGRKHYLGEGNDHYATLFDEEILLKTDEFLRKFKFWSK